MKKRCDYKGDSICTYSYNSFIPCRENPMPDNRIMDFITVGPFVLETDGSFESEHLYDRHKILLEDYLAPDGGEKNIIPQLGGKVTNKYYGKDFLQWEKGFIKWNCLRFDREEDAVDPALYATEQRNAVYYAAFYVECEKDELAIISHEDSGCALFVNGEQVDFKPFGRVKGLYDMGYQCPVKFRKGTNLVLFKLRPGYIADSMDISIAGCVIFPVIAQCGGLYITSPTKTFAFAGTKKNPRMIFPFFVFADTNIKNAFVKCDGVTIPVPDMKKGETALLRADILTAEVSKDKKCTATITVGDKTEKAPMYFSTVPFDGFTGNEHVFSDFHFDTTYHQEQRTYALGAFHITKSIVENLEKIPQFKAVLSEVDYLHPYYTLYPHHREAIKNAFTSGRAEADCFYNQPNDLTSSGEAFVRNLIYGQLYHRDVLGRISRVYVPGDVFGHFSQISQVCGKGGCDMVKWGKAMLGVDRIFRHISPDGTKMLHDKGFGKQEAIRLNMGAANPTSNAFDHIEAFPRTQNADWMKDTLSHARYSVFSDMADDIIESDNKNIKEGTDCIDLTSRDITQHHSGVLLTRTDLKQANRLCENLLISAEKFAAVAFIYGANYPEKALDKAWRQLLCAQHHDSITGTNNEISFIDLMAEYRECAETAADTLDKACRYIASLVENSTNKIALFNPVASPVAGRCDIDLPEELKGKSVVLTDKNGKEYPIHTVSGKSFVVAGKIPATGYSLFDIKEKEQSADPVAYGNDCVIENANLRVEVSRENGSISSVYNKKLKKEFIDSSAKSGANSIYALREIHNRMETQHEFYTTGQKICTDEFPAVIKSEKCKAYQKLTVTSTLGTLAKIIREITLYAGGDTVDFRTTIEDYNSEDDLFTAAFPVDINGGAVIFDDRFAPHVSTRSNKYMSFQTHQYASFSGCRVLPANQWFGTGPSVTVKMSKSSVNIGMTAIIRKENLRDYADTLLTALSKKGIPVTPYPDCEQHGGSKIIHFNEDIYETDTRFVLCVEGDNNLYAKKLVDSFSTATNTKINRRLEKDGIAVVFTRDCDNTWHRSIDVVLVIARDEDNLNRFAQSIADTLEDSYTLNFNSCIMDENPGKADEAGVSIINNGNISCSVEGKNTLNLMLFHTAAFYGNMGKVTGADELVPEKKTHIFTYSLYPHAGSYREAGVYTKACAFNEKLFAIATSEKSKNAFLPPKKSFLEAGEGFMITAFKAGGYPFASLKNEKSGASERGITIRGFEAHGTRASVKIKAGFGIQNAVITDLLDSGDKEIPCSANAITLPVTAHSIETINLIPKTNGQSAHSIEYIEKDLVEPTFVRSWEHDMGAVPTGFLRFAATLDRKLTTVNDNTTVVNINAVNNSADTNAEVTIKLTCSKGISADRKAIRVSLAPGESIVEPVTVTKKSADTKGQITAVYEYDGQVFTDVAEFGYFNPEPTLRIEGNKIICTVKNPTDQALAGSLVLATPLETWSIDGFNPNSYGNSGPLATAFELKAGEVKDYIFETDFDDEEYFKAYYAAVKLCCNGRIHFAFADRHGPRHNVWAHEFIREIAADNGSIEKLLKM